MSTEEAAKSFKVQEMHHEETEMKVDAAPEDEFPSVYSNAVSFVATPYDLRLNFSEVKPKAGKLINAPVVGVAMSWEHAKALVEILQTSISNHETDFGPLYHKKKSSGAE
jgi:hypothetical protein